MSIAELRGLYTMTHFYVLLTCVLKFVTILLKTPLLRQKNAKCDKNLRSGF